MTKIQSNLRNEAARRQSGRCYYCGAPMCTGSLELFAAANGLSLNTAREFVCTAEHLIALSERGETTADNIVAAHLFCNRTRHRRKKPQPPALYKARIARKVASNQWFTSNALQCARPRHTY
jgi:hypothetical protein